MQYRYNTSAVRNTSGVAVEYNAPQSEYNLYADAMPRKSQWNTKTLPRSEQIHEFPVASEALDDCSTTASLRVRVFPSC